MLAKLTNFPIAKNILFLALQMNKSLELGTDLIFTDDLEIVHNVNGVNYPWLWSRTKKNTDSKSWSLYFEDWKQPEFHTDKMQRISNCIKSVFKPKPEFIKEIISKQKKNIGLHIRRGDAKYYLGNPSVKKVVQVDKYTEIIRQRFNPDEYSIYCSSDSIHDVLSELTILLPEYEILHSVTSHNIPNIPFGQDIEHYLSLNNQYIEDVVISAIHDIHNLSMCDVFIGPFHDSVYSTVAALLCYNESKEIINIIDLSNEIRLDIVESIGVPL